MMSPNEVDVKLPRFKMEEKYDLEKILTKMGMENAFDICKRDFSGEKYCTNETHWINYTVILRAQKLQNILCERKKLISGLFIY